jgi:pimeloyl-ACP methyl ester carboxylesterase
MFNRVSVRGLVNDLQTFLRLRDIDHHVFCDNVRSIYRLAETPNLPTNDDITVAYERTRDFEGNIFDTVNVRAWYVGSIVAGVRRLVYSVMQWRMWLHGYRRTCLPSSDGTYIVWERVVEGTKPVVVFPGVGAGAGPYCTIIDGIFGTSSTIYMVEVPNQGGVATTSDRQLAAKTFQETLLPYVTGADLFGHSMGTMHCGMAMNASPIEENRRVVLVDPFCLPIPNLFELLLLSTISLRDYTLWRRLHPSLGLSSWFLMFLCVGRNLEFAAWSKFMELDSVILQRPSSYPNTRFLVSVGTDDCFLPASAVINYAEQHPESYTLHVSNNSHGRSLFGRHASTTIKRLKTWVYTER